MCATTTILLNRLKESNYRRRITHTHTDAHARTQTHCTLVTRARAHTAAAAVLRTEKNAHTHKPYAESTVLRRARTVSAHKFLSFIDQSAALLQPATAVVLPSPTALPPPPVRHTYTQPGAHSLPFSRTRRRSLRVSVAHAARQLPPSPLFSPHCPSFAHTAPTGSLFSPPTTPALRSLSLRLARSAVPFRTPATG